MSPRESARALKIGTPVSAPFRRRRARGRVMLALAGLFACLPGLPSPPRCSWPSRSCPRRRTPAVRRAWPWCCAIGACRPTTTRLVASATEPGQPGISGSKLVEAARAHGVFAIAYEGDLAQLEASLEKGRPVIAALGARGGLHHDVVVVGFEEGRVLLHDPSEGRDRSMRESDVRSALERRVALVAPRPAPPVSPLVFLLVAQGAGSMGPAVEAGAASYPALVSRGGRSREPGAPAGGRGGAGTSDRADPSRAEAFVERGGVLFLRSATRRPPATSDRRSPEEKTPTRASCWRRRCISPVGTDEALASWNRLGGPRVGAVEITGLRHTNDRVARRELLLREGERLDLDDLRESRRRLAETGAFEQVSVRTQPRGDGTADVVVALVERHGLASDPASLAVTTIAQLADRRLGLRYSNLGGRGASVFGSWRFATGRPELALGLDWPRPFGVDANLRLMARRGRQGYLFEEPVERDQPGPRLFAAAGARRRAPWVSWAFVSRPRVLGGDAVRGAGAGRRPARRGRTAFGGRKTRPAGRRVARVRLDARPGVRPVLPARDAVAALRARGGACAGRRSWWPVSCPARARTACPSTRASASAAAPNRRFRCGPIGSSRTAWRAGAPLGRSLLLFNVEWRQPLAGSGTRPTGRRRLLRRRPGRLAARSTADGCTTPASV